MRSLRWSWSWSYLVAIHVVLAVLVWKTDFLERVRSRLGVVAPPEFDDSWRHAVAFHRRVAEQLPPDAVLFVGDSLLQGLDVGRFGRRAANFGIGRDTTVGVLRRIDSYLVSPASTVVLLIGVNDLMYRDIEAIRQNHATLLARLDTAARVVAVGVLPVDERALGERWNARLRQVNTALSAACSSRTNCRYVDAWPSLADAGGGLAPAYHIGDGLHLGKAGYDRLAAAIAPALAP